MIDPRAVREYVVAAMLLHPEQAEEIAAEAAADPEGTAELAAEYAAAVDDDDDVEALLALAKGPATTAFADKVTWSSAKGAKGQSGFVSSGGEFRTDLPAGAKASAGPAKPAAKPTAAPKATPSAKAPVAPKATVTRAASPKPAPPQPVPSAKAAAAKKAHVMVDAKIQQYSEDHNEPKFAKAVGGASFPNGEPIDVAIPRKATDAADWQAATDGDRDRLAAWKDGGKKGKRPETTQLVGKAKHGIELKTMTVGEGGRIFMNSYAQVRKVVWEKESGAAFHTVVIDDRAVYNAGGEGVHDESQRKFYYRRGVAGSATVEGMHPCTTLEEVQGLMALNESRLPPNAQRTDSHLTAGDWLPFQDADGKGYRDKKTGDTVRAKK